MELWTTSFKNAYIATELGQKRPKEKIQWKKKKIRKTVT